MLLGVDQICAGTGSRTNIKYNDGKRKKIKAKTKSLVSTLKKILTSPKRMLSQHSSRNSFPLSVKPYTIPPITKQKHHHLLLKDENVTILLQLKKQTQMRHA